MSGMSYRAQNESKFRAYHKMVPLESMVPASEDEWRELRDKILPEAPSAELAPPRSKFQFERRVCEKSEVGFHVAMVISIIGKKKKIVAIENAEDLKDQIEEYSGLVFDGQSRSMQYDVMNDSESCHLYLTSSKCDEDCGCYLKVYLWGESKKKRTRCGSLRKCEECGNKGHFQDNCCGEIGNARVEVLWKHE